MTNTISVNTFIRLYAVFLSVCDEYERCATIHLLLVYEFEFEIPFRLSMQHYSPTDIVGSKDSLVIMEDSECDFRRI